jgi:hypothetical protein
MSYVKRLTARRTGFFAPKAEGAGRLAKGFNPKLIKGVHPRGSWFEGICDQ